MIELGRQKKIQEHFYNRLSVLLMLAVMLFLKHQNVNAELSYNFTKKELANGVTNEQKATLANSQDDKNKYYYNFNPDDGKQEDKNKKNNSKNNASQHRSDDDGANIDNIEENKKNKKIQPTGEDNVKVKLNIGGLAEAQYFYIHQPLEYKQTILPNGLPSSPASLNSYSIYQGSEHTINMLGKVDVNPEFIKYQQLQAENTGKQDMIIKVGAMLSQPFYNASKNTDPKLAAQEYIYLETKLLKFQVGAVNSASSRMRVDPQSLASGNGGVYGTWWRYINLPVFNTAGMSGVDLAALNAMSPVYILYPTLPNEAGFTVQRTTAGMEINSSMFAGGYNPDNLLYGAQAQGYPTQGAYSNKVSVYLKRKYGVSFGLSYSPTTAHTGFITRWINKGTDTFANLSGGFVKNYVSVGLDYRKQFDRYGLGIALSATYEHGESSPLQYLHNNNGTYTSIAVSGSKYYNRHNLNAFAVGAKVIWRNYSVAYSFGYWGHSLLNKYQVTEDGAYQVANQDKRSYYHTAGFGANYGPVRLGLTYMHSCFTGYKLDAWSVGTDYKMISLKYLRVQPYFEYVGYIFHTKPIQLVAGGDYYKASASRGYVITTGIKVVF